MQAWDPDIARATVERLKGLDGPLLPILHALQERFGWLPPPALPLVAEALNLSRAEVHGVATFYHDFRHQPPARHTIRLCRAEACQAMGADGLAETLKQAVRGSHEVALEAVYCLGNCALSPAALIDGALHGRLDAARALAAVGR